MAKIQTQIKEKESGARLMVFIIPAVFIIVFIFAAVKKIKIYDEFCKLCGNPERAESGGKEFA